MSGVAHSLHSSCRAHRDANVALSVSEQVETLHVASVAHGLGRVPQTRQSPPLPSPSVPSVTPPPLSYLVTASAELTLWAGELIDCAMLDQQYCMVLWGRGTHRAVVSVGSRGDVMCLCRHKQT